MSQRGGMFPQMRDDSGYRHLTLRISECVGKYWIVLICRYCHIAYRRPADLIAAHGDMRVVDFGRQLVCRRCLSRAPGIALERLTPSDER